MVTRRFVSVAMRLLGSSGWLLGCYAVARVLGVVAMVFWILMDGKMDGRKVG